ATAAAETTANKGAEGAGTAAGAGAPGSAAAAAAAGMLGAAASGLKWGPCCMQHLGLPLAWCGLLSPASFPVSSKLQPQKLHLLLSSLAAEAQPPAAAAAPDAVAPA